MVVHNRRNNSLSVNIRIVEIKRRLFHPIHRISILRSLQFLTEEIRGKSSRTSAIVDHMFLLSHFSFLHFLYQVTVESYFYFPRSFLLFLIRFLFKEHTVIDSPSFFSFRYG